MAHQLKALALLEFAESQKRVLVYIAKDIAHYDEIQKAKSAEIF